MRNVGNGTVIFDKCPSVQSFAAVVGKKEGEGPFGKCFDIIEEDEYFGQESWEKAESELLRRGALLAMSKGSLKKEALDFAISGDLLNQCISSGYALRELSVPFFGVYGACSTMAESLVIASMIISGGGAKTFFAPQAAIFAARKSSSAHLLNTAVKEHLMPSGR